MSDEHSHIADLLHYLPVGRERRSTEGKRMRGLFACTLHSDLAEAERDVFVVSSAIADSLETNSIAQRSYTHIGDLLQSL